MMGNKKGQRDVDIDDDMPLSQCWHQPSSSEGERQEKEMWTVSEARDTHLNP